MEKKAVNIKAFEDVKSKNGWKLMVKYLEKQIDNVEQVILENIDKELNKTIYTEHDLLRIKRSILKNMIKLPDAMIQAEDAIREGHDYSKEL